MLEIALVADINDETTIFHPAEPDYKERASETAWVEVIRGPQSGQKFPLVPGLVSVVGRAEDAEIKLMDTTISRRHSRITEEDGEHHLADLGSTNGTYVNQIRVAECSLHDGDLIQVGQTALRFRRVRSTGE